MRKGLASTGLILAFATLSDSWVALPAAGSGPKHEILVVRHHLRQASLTTVRLRRTGLTASVPQAAPETAASRVRRDALSDRPRATDPASWLGRKHLRSPS